MEKDGKKFIVYGSIILGLILIALVLGSILNVETNNSWIAIALILPLFFTISLMLFSLAKLVHKIHEMAGYFLYFIAIMWAIGMIIGTIAILVTSL